MKPVEGEERRIILATDLAENAVTLPAPASGRRRPLRSPPRGWEGGGLGGRGISGRVRFIADRARGLSPPFGRRHS